MDAVDYQRLADQYGAPAEERDYELACARRDLRHQPESVHGRDVYAIAADALTASRARPRPQLTPVEFTREAWTAGDALAARWR